MTQTATDGFTTVFGSKRGSDREHVPTGLARFSYHPSRILIREDADTASAVASIREHAQQLQNQAQVLTAAAEAGWEVRVIDGSRDHPWLSISCRCDNAKTAADELVAFGADRIRLDFFPSGDVTSREGMRAIDIENGQLFLLNADQAKS
jgi:hypothetical protein